ncbi:helix-turn-helix transcriptional regulator [Sphingomonas baiyangensis]|uniref:Helix-turn-helix transcriptional regulator n=1 Tax=Sphingomonas baiyangensis TaxID=2572576 RepID=A0A4U1KZY1_9SPHN|nr:AraC family transcriptional regulator [Sphingomonas baiyangensis]TKD49997.1 helix-turn-helix transcriptional regulator [Sphingomonas baiyangensis]
MAMALIPRTGQTMRGLPVSVNRAPAPDLARHIARMFVTIVDQPADAVVDDFILNETGFMRVLVRGQWEALVADSWQAFDGALLFGAQSRPMRVRVRGPFTTAGFAVLPGAWVGLTGTSAVGMTDQLRAMGDPLGAAFATAAAATDDPDMTLAALETVAREWVARTDAAVDPIAEAFEALTHADPTLPVAAIAARLGVSERTLDRRVQAGFGVSPKLVLRRSRFLDMAAVTRGLAFADLDVIASLRFYDQSHRTREFRRFAGMTPGQFERTPTPLLTLGLESRQRRKFESTAALPGLVPWLA